MKTSIELPNDLILSIREHNKKNPGQSINISGVCRQALVAALKKAMKRE